MTGGPGPVSVRVVAVAALEAVGVAGPPGGWSPGDVDRCLDLALVLTDLADVAAKLQEKRATRDLWTTTQD